MNALAQLPPLRDVISRHGLSAKKSMGQNFLLDLNLTEKIARSAGNLNDATVLEIGPGPGGLTRSLLAQGVEKVIAIERDQRFFPALNEIQDACPGRLELIAADALNVDFKTIIEKEAGPTKIIANLPYNIATPLLTGWLSDNSWPSWFQSMTLMFQKEVAHRICAKPGEKPFGRLSVLANWRCTTHLAFEVPSSAFVPPPKIASAIVNLAPITSPLECNLAKLEQITRAAFGQRRKMLRASLKGLGGVQLLEKAGIDPKLRAEVIEIEDFVRLANLI